MFNIKKIIYFCCLAVNSFLFTSCETDKNKNDKQQAIKINNSITKYNQHKPFFYETREECKKILEDPVLIRLKGIDQSGPANHFSYTIPPYSRLSHSIGVYNILKKNYATKAECVAGLYHDASHTVFSHTSDYLGKDYQRYVEESMHDSKLTKILDNKQTLQILYNEGLTPNMIDVSKNNFKMLDAPLPELCADRIEYTLHTAYLLGLLTLNQMEAIYNDLFFNKELGYWYFMHDCYAFMFGYCSLILNLKFWAAPWCFQQNMHLAKALRLALKLHVITEEELFTLTDKEVINRLKCCENEEIKKLLDYARIYTLDDKNCPYNGDYELIYFRPKFRGVDPRVGTDCKKYSQVGKLKKVFNLLFDEVKQYCRKGYWVPVARCSIDNID